MSRRLPDISKGQSSKPPTKKTCDWRRGRSCFLESTPPSGCLSSTAGMTPVQNNMPRDLITANHPKPSGARQQPQQPSGPKQAFARAKAAALADERIGAIFEAVDHIETWLEADQAEPWFSEWHCRTKGFSLPFNPENCLWAPATLVLPVVPSLCPHAYYRRGVARYSRHLLEGFETPPVCYVWTSDRWRLLDGNHRYEAHVITKRPFIRAQLAIVKSLVGPVERP